MENSFGNDTETTTISICSMLAIFLKTYLRFLTWQVQVNVKMVSQTIVLRSVQEKMECMNVAAILVSL